MRLRKLPCGLFSCDSPMMNERSPQLLAGATILLFIGISPLCAQPVASPGELTEERQKELEARLRQPDTKSIFSLPESFPNRALTSDKLPGTSAEQDRDFDGLNDTEELRIGTDPTRADTDGDGLWDSWEVLPFNGMDLRALGASPLRKDIFIEMDYMVRKSATNQLAPNRDVLKAIQAVFASAPVSNPDGSLGITLHLELDDEIAYVENLTPVHTAFRALKGDHFKPERLPVYHYMIWANAYDGGTSSGYSMGIPHSDFVVTLGRWNNGQGGTDAQKIGTFIHELGHNLGLRHGGSDDTHHKPNHLSVMNYSFQTSGILKDGRRVFDFQRFELPRLNERQLFESHGLGKAPALRGYSTFFSTANGEFLERDASVEIDWNGNGSIDERSLRVDLNDDRYFTELKATAAEWPALVFKGGSIGQAGTLQGLMSIADDRTEPLPFVELTEEMDKRIRR